MAAGGVQKGDSVPLGRQNSWRGGPGGCAGGPASLDCQLAPVLLVPHLGSQGDRGVGGGERGGGSGGSDNVAGGARRQTLTARAPLVPPCTTPASPRPRCRPPPLVHRGGPGGGGSRPQTRRPSPSPARQTTAVSRTRPPAVIPCGMLAPPRPLTQAILARRVVLPCGGAGGQGWWGRVAGEVSGRLAPPLARRLTLRCILLKRNVHSVGSHQGRWGARAPALSGQVGRRKCGGRRRRCQ